MLQRMRKSVGGDAFRLVAHELVSLKLEQLWLLTFRVAPPAVECGERGDVVGQLGVVEGVNQLLVHQHVGAARFVFEVLDLAQELLVVL
jgi:hypothetical protein